MHSYAYLGDSRLDEARRALGLQTSGGRTANPLFFTGFLTSAAPTAAGLLAVAKVAQARYFQPTRERLRDPVVTCSGDRLRFESFSGCCGVYARLDVLSGGLDGEVHDRGTTNIDVNEPLRRSLSRVTTGDPLHLTVGPDSVGVGTFDGVVVEKKVPLPPRWLRGFAEAQVITAQFDLRAELSPTDATRFLRSLPRSGGLLWAVPSGRTLRLTGRPTPGAVCLAGPQRLEALTPLLRFAKALRVYGPVVSSLPVASGWEVDLGNQRLVVVLSPEVTRGLSGEGAVLDALAAEDSDTDTELVGALLDFEPRVDVEDLAERSGLSRPRVRDAITRLGTAGRVGYDLAEASYFHRELPYTGNVEAMNPRLVSARALVDADAVRIDGQDAVVGAYRIHQDACTCSWWAEYQGTRGKCKHVLATDIVRGRA